MQSPLSVRTLGLFCLGIALLTGMSCGGGSSSASGAAPPGVPTSSAQFGPVVLVVEENHNYSDVIGSTSMPYLNSLVAKYGLATQYYANIHPSMGNYFMLTTGQIITTDDGFTGTVNEDNIVRELLAAGKTWKSYAEGLPSVGYTGGDVYPYVKRHNILEYLSDVVGSSTQMNNLVPFSQFASDVSNNQLPNFSFIVPNLINDAHDAPLGVADAWLQKNMPPLISSPAFQKNGLLIIAFDEADGSDTSHGGGRVVALIVSPQAKAGYQSTSLYQHQSTLRLILQRLGVSTFPGAAAQATDMGEFF
ncbi:MAG: alkaline phosphatase family protein [Terriglobales bacterium]